MQTGYLTKLALLFAVYFVTARLGLSLDAVSGFAAAVWPPTGIALVAILVLGYRYWPAIFVGALVVNLAMDAPLLVAIGIGAGNTLEAVAGAYLLRRIQFRHSLERIKDVIGLVVLAAMGSTMVSATIGVTCLLASGIVTAAAYDETWLAWWMGDMIGCLIIAPLLLVWIERPRFAFSPKRLAEAAALIGIIIVISFAAIRASLWLNNTSFTFAYVIFPVLVWIALRFRQRGSTAAIFIVSTIAVWSTVAYFDTTTGESLGHILLLLQSFMGITAVTFMTMSAIVSEQEQTQRRQQKLLEKTALLTKQRSRLLALNEAKDEFISLASHQLRTPATGVKQYLNMLLEGYAGKLTERQRKMVLVANEINEREIQIINDLLKVAQVDAGKVQLKIEKIDVPALITDVIGGQASTLAARHQTIAFRYEGIFHCYADKEKLRMVIENIVDNASKYSPAGEGMEIALRKEADRLLIDIKDNGIGINKPDLAKLFKKFSRIENPAAVFVGGSGLGLYWAHRIIDLHGGAITVASEPGQGSVFTISLPRKNSKSPIKSRR